MTTTQQPETQLIRNSTQTRAFFMAFGVNHENNNDASFQLCGAQFGHLLPLNLQTYPHVKKTKKATTYYQFSVPNEDEAMTGCPRPRWSSLSGQSVQIKSNIFKKKKKKCCNCRCFGGGIAIQLLTFFYDSQWSGSYSLFFNQDA